MKEREIACCRALILAIVLVVLYASSSYAEIVQYRLTGIVSIFDRYNNLLPPDLVSGADSDVLNPPGPDATGGKPFVAYWAYDNSIPDTAPEPYLGNYLHPLADPLTADYGLTVQIDGYVFHMNTSIEPYTVGLSVGLLTPPIVD